MAHTAKALLPHVSNPFVSLRASMAHKIGILHVLD